MSKVVVLGVTGRVGSRIAAELLKRGHRVTGVARNVERAPELEGLVVKRADASKAESLVPVLQGHDVVVSSTRFVGGTDAATLLAAMKQAGVSRLIAVGGAGSLEVAPGKQLIDTMEFPDAYKPEALAGRAFLDALRAENDVNWTFISPSAQFEPGERTGRYRLAEDNLLVDDEGRSHISMEDYAIALADELETPKYSRRRFTVGY